MDASEDVFMITRIADRGIVRTLLQTPVLRFQQEIATKSKLPPGIKRDLIGNDAHLFDLEGVQPDEMAMIDLEANKLDGEEAELAYDPLYLILQSRQRSQT